ncbi:hypothetical protein L1887_38651 [Cichorium endivia]|nr:hypothetical protein L1887_38651 [Cichorium endivia]
MRKYSHLLAIGKSKGLSISNKRWFQAGSSITSHNHRHYSQSPPSPPPSPPLPFSYNHISRSRCSGISSLSNNYTQNTISKLNHNQHKAQLSTLHSLEVSNHERHPMDYKVTVKDRDVISAAQAPAHEMWLPQTNLDLLLPPLAAEVFFCYKKKDDTAMSIKNVLKTLKTSLADVLSTYYPLAGEIVPNSLGEPEILCNNNGVEFVHAHADVDLETLDFHKPDETVKGKLVPKINRGVFSVQVTELNCGSIILSCAFDHRIADGHSSNTFLVAWAEFAQFKKITTIPSFRPSILQPRFPPIYDTTFDDLYIPISSVPPPPTINDDQLHSRIYYVPTDSINHLQSQASTKETRRSKFLSFTAYIWKLLAQEGDNDVNKKSRMGVVVSGRQFLTGEESFMIQNHFGNILSIPYGEANNRHLQEMTLNEVANKVHRFVTKTTNEDHFRGLVDWVELHRPEPAVARIYFKLQETDGDAVVVSSGQGFPIKDMKFGWGEPEFGSYHFPWGGQTGYIATMPSAMRNGDWVIYAHLKQKHLDLIESKASGVINPTTHSYLHFR